MLNDDAAGSTPANRLNRPLATLFCSCMLLQLRGACSFSNSHESSLLILIVILEPIPHLAHPITLPMPRPLNLTNIPALAPAPVRPTATI